MVANMCCSFVSIRTGESKRTPCCASVGAIVKGKRARLDDFKDNQRARPA